MLRIKSELFGTIELPIDKIEDGDEWHSLSNLVDINVFVDHEDRQVRALFYPVWTDKGTTNTNHCLEECIGEAVDFDFDPFYVENATNEERCVEYFRKFGLQARVFRDNDVLLHIPEFNGEVLLHPEEIETRAKLYDATSDDRYKNQ
jgi:hypothetical protein